MLDTNLEREIVNSILKDKENSLNKKINEKFENLEIKLNERLEKLNSKISGKPLEYNLGTVEKPDNKMLHSKFDTIIKILQSAKRIEKHIMLVGPAGGGKTSLCSDVAKALKLDFYPMSVGLQTTKSDLVGFINAKGDYITTPVREAFEKGGLLLLDEFDATNPSTVTILNSMLANNVCSFPDKKIEKNKDFICIVACNTYGRGADINYIGRNRLDASTLDRFIVLNVDYDENLEKSLTQNEKWYKCIQKMRRNIAQHGIKMVISPRASMQGADLLESGFPFEDVIEMTILKGVNDDIRNKVLNGISYNEKTKDGGVCKQKIVVVFDIAKKHLEAKFDQSCQLIQNLDWDGPSIYFSKEGEYLQMIDSSKVFINDQGGYIQPPCDETVFLNLINQIRNSSDSYNNKEITLDLTFLKGSQTIYKKVLDC